MHPEQHEEPEPQSNWQFNPDEPQSDNQPESPTDSGQTVSWTASEFIAHEKNFGWFVLLALATAALMLVVYVMTRDIVSAAIVLIAATLFGIYAVRKPRVLPYTVDSHGIQIGNKQYPYGLFKAFSVIQEGGIRSLMLLPLKRFMPPISLYMDPEDEGRITEVLSDYLPTEQRQQDPVERLMRRLRF